MSSTPGTELRRRSLGAAVSFIGFMLSPLSWWNDLFVNVPIALAFAWIISLFYKPAFDAALVFGYWLTNVLGFVLMHKGAQKVLTAARRKYSAGYVDFLIVTDAERTLNTARDQLADIHRARLTALVALYKALGGGWMRAGTP